MADRVKAELDMRIKADPDAPNPPPGQGFADDELDEANDLEFYEVNPQIPYQPSENVYLVRLPPLLWEQWAHLDDDAEIEIGQVRQWTETGKDGTPQARLQLKLADNLAQHQGLEKEYDLSLMEQNVKNTFVFTERHLEGFAAKNKERAAALAQGIPAHLLRQQQPKQQKPSDAGQPGPQKGGRGLKRAPYFRRAIPKKTAIYGRVRHEVTCTPVQNAEWNVFSSRRALETQERKAKVGFVPGLPPDAMNTVGSSWDSFIKVKGEVTKPKGTASKHARWPQNVIVERLIELFMRHKYWTMGRIKLEVPQPESYIRETLATIAALNKGNDFNNTYSLVPHYFQIMEKDRIARGLAPPEDAIAGGAGAEDDDDEDIQMEDVV